MKVELEQRQFPAIFFHATKPKVPNQQTTGKQM